MKNLFVSECMVFHRCLTWNSGGELTPFGALRIPMLREQGELQEGGIGNLLAPKGVSDYALDYSKGKKTTGYHTSGEVL